MPGRRSYAIALLLGVLALTGCNFLRGYAEGSSSQLPKYKDRSQPGFYRLLFDDFRSLNTDTMERSAVPWKVSAAALMLYHEAEPMTRDRALRLYAERFGLVTPSRIENLPGGEQPSFEHPLGLVAGVVKRSWPTVRIEVVNTGCSTCHSANLYDAKGNPTKSVWVGLPSSSFNPERYAVELYASLRQAIRDKKQLLDAVKTLFPETSSDELSSLRKHVLPALKDKLRSLDASLGRFTAYSNGGPGLTNGVARVKADLGVLGQKRFHDEEYAFAAIPELYGLRLKRSILSDGVYRPPGKEAYGRAEAPGSEAHRVDLARLVTLVTMSTLGNRPKVAASNTKRIRKVVDYLVSDYEPPPFPGSIDDEKADAGEAVFARKCEHCHGRYAKTPKGYRLVEFPNRLVSQDVMETDATRWQSVNDRVIRALESTALGRHIDAKRAGGYVAPSLVSIWATAPYFHNGSVPTLWHLMEPEQRPQRFLVGGHRLDFDRVGIAGELDADGQYLYPKGYEPWTEPELFDASSPGKSNAGHQLQFEGLSANEKEQLIEFLKRL